MNGLRGVEVYNACRCIIISTESVCNLFWQLDQCECFRINEGDLSISFVSKKTIKEIHTQFLNDASLTDVITFQGDPDFNFAGEIVVCPLYAFKQSNNYKTSFQEEIKLYLIHGYLHLYGLHDKTEKEVQEMRAAETFCMSFLKNFSLQVSLKNPIS